MLLIILLTCLSNAWALPNNEGGGSIKASSGCHPGGKAAFNSCRDLTAQAAFCKCVDNKSSRFYPNKSQAERHKLLTPRLADARGKLLESVLELEAKRNVLPIFKQAMNLHHFAVQMGMKNLECVNSESIVKQLGAQKNSVWQDLIDVENDFRKVKPKAKGESGLIEDDKEFLLDHFSSVFHGAEQTAHGLQHASHNSKTKNENFATSLIEELKENRAQLKYRKSLVYKIYISNNGYSANSFHKLASQWSINLNLAGVNTPEGMREFVSSSSFANEQMKLFARRTCAELNKLISRQIKQSKNNKADLADSKLMTMLSTLEEKDPTKWRESIEDLNGLINLHEPSKAPEAEFLSFKSNVDQLYCFEFFQNNRREKALSFLSAKDLNAIQHLESSLDYQDEDIKELNARVANLELGKCQSDWDCPEISELKKKLKDLYELRKNDEKHYLKLIASRLEEAFLKDKKGVGIGKILLSFGINADKINHLSNAELGDLIKKSSIEIATGKVNEQKRRNSSRVLIPSINGFVTSTSSGESKKRKSRKSIIKSRFKGALASYKVESAESQKVIREDLTAKEKQNSWSNKFLNKAENQVARGQEVSLPMDYRSPVKKKEKYIEKSSVKKNENKTDFDELVASLFKAKKETSDKEKTQKTLKDSAVLAAEKDLEMIMLKKRKIQLEIESLALEKEKISIGNTVDSLKKSKSLKKESAQGVSQFLEASASRNKRVIARAAPKARSSAEAFGSASGAKNLNKQAASSESPAASASANKRGHLSTGDYAITNTYSTPSFTLTQGLSKSFSANLLVLELKENILSFPPAKREEYIQNLFKDRKDSEILVKLPSGEFIKIKKGTLKLVTKDLKKAPPKMKSSPAKAQRKRYKLEDLESHLAPLVD